MYRNSNNLIYSFYKFCIFIVLSLFHFFSVSAQGTSDNFSSLYYTVTLDSLKNYYPFTIYVQKGNSDHAIKTNTHAYYSDKLSNLKISIPIVKNERVYEYINIFAKAYSNELHFTWIASKYHQDVILASLKFHGLPEELVNLPAILSGYNIHYTSKGASGPWQLYYPQARLYKLTVASLVDERRNMQLSTQAASTYLKDLFDMYKDWRLAITAYVVTPAILNKAARRAGSMEYESILPFLPDHAKDVYPAFIAFLYLKSQYDNGAHAKSLSIFEAKRDSVKLNRNISKKAISDKLSIQPTRLSYLNPTIRTDIIPANMYFYLPEGTLARFIENKDNIFMYQDSVLYKPVLLLSDNTNIQSPVKSNQQSDSASISSGGKVSYKVKAGDNLGYIATLYNVKVTDIQKWNNIQGTKINIGQTLVIFVPESKADTYKNVNEMSKFQKDKIIEQEVAKEELEQVPDEKQWILYKVAPGDNLFNIAKKYPGISAEKIMELNSITEDIYPGQILKIKRK